MPSPVSDTLEKFSLEKYLILLQGTEESIPDQIHQQHSRKTNFDEVWVDNHVHLLKERD